ncbi:dipeptidase [Alicyclobacillus ferrooxydans]|uniref:Peptidase M20 n=1 Tax=Alicyclobacillus ferrooxydans TaxID=471514 RepID=A0A0P9CVK7_9BACL|nr:dipeptidase [Alicyclobacillus ferrooxydans]KPV43745.1 peptidase M20 [Alicyclobacillus ferrooxydans]
MTASWQEYLDLHQQRFIDELLSFLKIPSVSTDSAYAGEVRNAARWIAARMERAGIEGVQVMETTGHPVVYGEWLHAEGQPTLLIYGHFDVQPADPLELWVHPPFEPTIDGDLVYARGASDMKGNDLLPVIACEALLQTTGAIPVNVKFLFEGEEEIGSASLEPFIRAHEEMLSCDMVVCADGGVGSKAAPVVNVGRRGLIGLEVQVTSAATDLHSGGAGGIAPNAIHALSRILDSFRDHEGRILVDGFYRDVRPLTEEDRTEIAKYPFHAEDYQAKTGIKAFFGEPEFTPQERNTARPTLEINGIWGGYQGEGTKTVIPREAFAKITCRLVPDQEPEHIQQVVAAHIRRFTPKQVDVTVTASPGDAEAYVLDRNHPGLAALEEALTAASDAAPVRVRGGGTVPITAMFKNILGVDTITLGATLGHDGAHAPNEHFSLSNFARIQRVFCMLFEKIGAGVVA